MTNVHYLEVNAGTMPSPNEDKDYKNLTLRLPDEYHRQMVSQAARMGLTLSAHLNNIVRRHLMESGFAPDVLKSLSGRLFEINVEAISQGSHRGDFYCSRFDIFESHPLYTKRRAHYIFGVDEDLVGSTDPYGLVRDLGLALLNFYNRKGFEIDQLAWQISPSDPSSPSPSMKDNWRYIDQKVTTNINEFMIHLSRNHWKDELLVMTGQSQDIRCNLRKERDLYR